MPSHDFLVTLISNNPSCCQTLLQLQNEEYGFTRKEGCYSVANQAQCSSWTDLGPGLPEGIPRFSNTKKVWGDEIWVPTQHQEEGPAILKPWNSLWQFNKHWQKSCQVQEDYPASSLPPISSNSFFLLLRSAFITDCQLDIGLGPSKLAFRVFRAVKILDMIIAMMMVTFYYTFTQTPRMYTTKRKP